MIKRFRIRNFVPALVLAGAVMGASALPASAQDGLILRNIFGKIGLLPDEKEPIDYNERPTLVVPKDTKALRRPEDANAHAKNGQWPSDPDVLEKKREIARRNQPILPALRSDPLEGGRLSVDDLAKGRSTRGAKIGEDAISRNDTAGVRMNPDDWAAISSTNNRPSYAPGTEPPRQYLTDPPKGLRIPSADAPMVRTTEAPAPIDNGRPEQAWKRLD